MNKESNYGKKRQNRKTIRIPYRNMRNLRDKVIFLYGKLLNKEVAIGYCELHKCYLAPNDIKEKKCKIKKCKYFKRKENKYGF